MLTPFICGNFHNQEQEDDPNQISPCSTPTRKSKTKKDNKNPYSTRGLDKFSALLAELEEKRKQIYSQVGSQDISFVRFVYSSSNDCVPVIVKIKDPQRPSTDQNKNIIATDHQSNDKVQVLNEEIRSELEINRKKNKKKVYFKLHKWRRPSYYMPLFVILILLFLAVFGRSVAILCTSIGWYLVPTLSSKTNSNKKKQLVRRFSEVGTKSSNHIVGSYGKNLKTPHGRQNSF